MDKKINLISNNIGISELATYLGVSKATIYRTVVNQQGFPPAIKIGKNNKWDKRAVDAWLESQRNLSRNEQAQGGNYARQ